MNPLLFLMSHDEWSSECIFFFCKKTVTHVDIVREFVELVRVRKEINRSNTGSCSSGGEEDILLL